MIIAIDGPAGAGKSTISRQLALRLGFVRIDTGALYRTVALAASEAGLTPESGPLLADFVRGLDLKLSGDAVLLADADVSDRIRAPRISLLASRFAAVPAVRAGLLDLQRRLGRASDSVMDGRDIGTVVFPDADAKIFLTASVEERARRRHAELLASGQAASLSVVHAEIELRDRQDTERAVAPLRRADGAVLIDATDSTIEEAVAACAAVVDAARRK